MKRNIWRSREARIPIGAVLPVLGFLVCGCGAAPVRQQSAVDIAMGTIVTQTLYVQQGSGGDYGNEEAEDAESSSVMGLLTDLERQELSWRMEGSEVAKINALASAGGIDQPGAGDQPEAGDQPGTGMGDQSEAGGIDRSGTGTEDQSEVGAGDQPGTRTGDQSEAGDQPGTGTENQPGDGGDLPRQGDVQVALSPSMREILERIWRISADSGGALDVTLGRLSRLWNMDGLAAEGEGEGISIPSTDQIRSALEERGYERVRFAGDGMILPAGMQLDLGAVGKGIACDRVSAYLHSQPQITGAVVTVGGSVVTYGEKPDGSPWKVAVIHPREEGNYLGVLSLTGEQYVSTSGDYERYVMVDGVRYHHILDPATGYPARSGLCSVTVLCDGGLLADALSTACFVLGPERGMALAENYGAEALFVREDGELQMTEGMKEIFSAGG